MTPQQFTRWKDFAERMARTCYAGPGREGKPSGEWVLDAVQDFIGGIEDLDIPVIQSWDNSDDYPEGHPWHNATEYAWGTAHTHGPCVGDLMSSFEWEGWHEIVEHMPNALWKRYERLEEWDPSAADRIRDAWSERYFGAVHCCVRAGLDMACEPSAGVVGFTAGDLRRMYPDGVPEWIVGAEQKLVVDTFVPHPLGLQIVKSETNGTFDELPDTAGMWL